MTAIDRYISKEIQELWSDSNKFQLWIKIEMAVLLRRLKIRKYEHDVLTNNYSLEDWSEINSVLTEFPADKFEYRCKELEEKTKHDVTAFLEVIESIIPEKLQSTLRFMHYGLTSSDVVDTAFSILLEQSSEKLAGRLELLSNTLYNKKIPHIWTYGRTHGQAADSMLYYGRFDSFRHEVERNIDRLRNIEYVGKLSGAVGSNSYLKVEDETEILKSLGLGREDGPTQVVQRDRYAQFFTTLAIIASSLERMALSIRNLARTEIAEVAEGTSVGQYGSSAMPHKKNPISCEKVCGLARIIRANAMASLENIALHDERDISHSSVERIIAPQSIGYLDHMIQTMVYVIENLVFFDENIQNNALKVKEKIESQKRMHQNIDEGLSRSEAHKRNR